MSAAADRARRRAAEAQRPAADPAASVWVAASAGTGKTKVLTDRALSLMLHGTAPGRILCLTFTKAAAAEMANRLAQRLARWATTVDADLTAELTDLLGRAPDEAMRTRARELFARVLDAPGGMKIQTIHAFCQSLLGRFPLEAGVAPHFQVLDERSAEEMLQQAREEVLAAARDGGAEGQPASPLAAALAEVAVHVQEQDFAKLVGAVVQERARLRRLTAPDGDTERMIGAVFRALDVDPDATEEAIVARACADAAFDHMGLRLAVQAMAEGAKTDREHAALIAEWLAVPAAARPGLFAAYLRAYFTEKGEGSVFKTLVHKDALASAPGIDAVLAGEAARLEAVRDEINRARVARATAGLLRLGHAILEAYGRHKEARALLDYDDLILRARDLLEGAGAAWVLFKLDGGLDHVLVDEAQDTNPEQWEVIDRLSAEFFAGEGAREGPRTVFAVGDAKQSIFSFQRADPAAFARMRGHFAERARQARQSWAKVELAHSFRSSAAVLAAVDAVFARAEARDGVLAEDEAPSHAPVRLGQAGLVELWPPAPAAERAETAPWEPPLDRRGAPPARTRLARLIARRIWRWTTAPLEALGADARAESLLESKHRRLRPGDILVLVRRRNEFVEELVRELKRLEVPVAGVDRMILRDQLAVMDLIALGRALLLPEDDLTLAAVLKGPLIGLSEEQLFRVAHGRAGNLWDSLARHARADAEIGAARAALLDLMAGADFVPPHELYAGILEGDWGRGRGRARLLARLGPDAADPIEEFLSLALAYEREHVPSLEGFLHWIEVGAQEVKRDMEHGQDSVRVMTVHGAKGLQAPVVLLPDTMQVPKGKDGVFWLDDEGIALWPPRKGYDGALSARARAAAEALQAREYRRLLYVALTRAEDRLYVAGWQSKNAAPDDCWYKLVERALAGAGEPAAFDFTGEIGDGGWAGPGWRMRCAQTAAAETERGAPGMRAPAPAPLPDWAQARPRPEPAPPRPLAPSRPAAEEMPVVSPLGPDGARRFQRGRLIHSLLQSLPDIAPDRRRAAAERFLASPAHGLDAAERAEIAEAALAVLEDAAFAPLFGPGSRAEVPVVGVVESRRGAQVVSGQVDRLRVDADAVTVVDYKSNRPAPADEAGVPALYMRQMAAYRAVLAGVYPDRRIECALLWTDGPRLMQLSDAVLARHAP